MTVALKKQLDESLRDALLAFFLNNVAPNDETTRTLKTAQHLYEYWFLDVLVSQDVPTTPVACAIASLQHYINCILMSMEPGYDATTLTLERMQTWRNEMHQYPIWAAHQQLLYFPATYLEPSLRNNKSDNFQQLENDLSQHRIQPDAVQSAVLGYLTRFEEVANLNILNGYIDGEDFANSTYYFIAKSRSENTYFWRSLNMAQRPLDGTPPQPPVTPPKLDQPLPYAWSDWEKADVPIPDDAIEHTIRPVWFNNRLFIIWAQCIHQDPAAVNVAVTPSGGEKNNSNPQLRLSLCYRKTDKTWSSPRICLQGFIEDKTLREKHLDSIKPLIGTIAVHHQNDLQDYLLIALYVENSPSSESEFTFLKTVSVDKNLALTPGMLAPGDIKEQKHNIHSKFVKAFSTPSDKNSLQLNIPLQANSYELKKLGTLPAPINRKDMTNVRHLNTYTPPIPIIAHASYKPATVKVTLSISGNKPTSTLTLQDAATGEWSYQYVLLGPEGETTSNINNQSPLQESLPYQHIFTLNATDIGEEGKVFHYGIKMFDRQKRTENEFFILGAIELKLIGDDVIPPKIVCANAAQFLDFSNSTISQGDNKKEPRQPIKLNTGFASEMIHRTENSLDELFAWETQHLPEPPIPRDVPHQMDFHGPYGRYFTELFLYLPWLIAHRLNAERQYDEAERWIRYLFDPGRKQDADQPAHWCAKPLTGDAPPFYSTQAPHDPHQIALSHPVHFRKALYFLYLDILINRGDAAYRELTSDSLSEAKLWYMRALDLLGPRPVVQRVDQWSAISLHTLSEAPSGSLRTFENSLSHPDTIHSLQLQEGNPQKSLPPIDTSHLHLPFNPDLLKRWDIAEIRLYNLRHNLDITGKPLHLPLFAAPLNPRSLRRVNALNSSTGGTLDLPNSRIPHYRFNVIHSQALNAVESVSQFGATLLSLIERKEQAQLQELQQQQAWNLAKLSVDLQTQALRIDRQNRQALLASKAIIEGRLSHYQQLLTNDVTQEEAAASQRYLSSGASEVAASASQVVAGGMMMTPNIFGFSNGGSRWEGAMHAASALAQGNAIANRTAANHLDRMAQFSRRREEWSLNRNQAERELAQIDAQLAHFTEQETATRLQLRLAETTLNQAKANYDLLSKRFTKAQVYQWLNSQFATMYYQAYDVALGMCLAAEACWQYEIADFTARFIQPGAWSATYRGLGAGEQLKLSLLRMQAAYLERNGRELEIRKTVSLRQLKDKDKDKDSTINKDWTSIQTDLKKGVCDFELTHKTFEDDYKNQNHYLLRIKTISVSLPALLGPYENVRATLTQTSSKVYFSPGDQTQPIEDLRANQQIALSTGFDDNGLFTLNFNDERYLPFEYTGAISTWRLTFPNPEAQQAMLDSLTDIIVHVSYTARAAGGSQ
ncbi:MULTISPECIES: neuraminidase-like domain-containing protein [Pseudomonas]|uniref:Toxin n=1 Tax=Pseudomonas fluorescens TaxID=294 RepID=A0A166N235_PSEFL|nr:MULTISPECIES: neuraminidase-like domain-containing protein [Pseudomonas]KZN16609.1 toxin [Pseudomonas fluorescens]